MIATSVTLAGELLLLDPSGILVWPRESLLAVADLHLEKGSAAASLGALLPPWDSAITLRRLAAACERYRPRLVVAVGDSFHDDGGPGRLSHADRALLAVIESGRRLLWVAGNHDPAPPEGMPGEAMRGFRLDGLRFRHQATPGATCPSEVEICGHHHPKARVATRGGIVSRPCFVVCAGSGRLMLPAFGAYAGGLDVRDPAISALFPRGGRLFLTGSDRLFGFPLPEAAPAAI